MKNSHRWISIALLVAVVCLAQIGPAAEAAASSEADEVVTMDEPSVPTIRAPASPPPRTSPPRTTAVRKASPAGASRIADFRFPVGLSFVSGTLDLKDYAEDRTDMDVFAFPVALGISPYYQFAHGSQIWLDIGPSQLVMVDGDVDYWGVPVGLSYGFAFLPRSSFSPYARVGFKYPIAGGDWVESSSPGLFGAVGVEFMRKRMVGLGIELGYDGSEVEMETGESIQPGQVLFSVRAVF